MKLSRVQLLAYLTILHYPKEVMETWQKPYLVKQMLTRFNIYPDWNPADYTTNQVGSDWVHCSTSLYSITFIFHSSFKQNGSEMFQGTMVVSPTRPRTTMHLPTASKQGPRRPNKDVNNSPENHIYDLPITTDQTKNQPANKKESAPPKPQRLPSLRKSRCSSLKDITSADRFDAMSASDLNIFLKQWLDDECRHPGRAEDLRFVLKYLWDKSKIIFPKNKENALHTHTHTHTKHL